MSTADQHRRMREQLGAYVLGALPPEEAVGVRAHLDGCSACRAELAEIAPLADDLRAVDPEALSTLPVPPAELGERIRSRVGAERALVGARTRQQQRQVRARRSLAVAAALVLVAGAVGVGAAVGRSTAPAGVAAPPPAAPSPAAPPAAPAPQGEQVAVRAVGDVRADPATVIAHTWGVEARFEGAGFDDGEVYRAAFRSTDGRLLPAGEFLGTGDRRLKCNMQSALLRDDATGFVVVDSAGRTVLAADL